MLGLQDLYLGKQLTVWELSLSNYKSHLVLLKPCRSHHGLEPSCDSTAFVLSSHLDGDSRTKSHQHHAALPCCTMEIFSTGPCRSVSAGVHNGQKPEEVLACSLQHLCPSLTTGMLRPRRWKGLVYWGDLAEGSCFRLWLRQMS